MTTLESIAYRKKYTGVDDLRESERERESIHKYHDGRLDEHGITHARRKEREEKMQYA